MNYASAASRPLSSGTSPPPCRPRSGVPDINIELSMGITHKQPLPRRELLMRLVLLGTSTLISILVLEFALRLLSPPSPFTRLIPLRPRYKTQFHLANFNGMSLHPRYSTNKWGLRGEELTFPPFSLAG